jgi:predicted protein tyrosine phosphatase
MAYRPNILVVCARNKKRSRTAEFLFKNDPRFSIRSAGLSPSSIRKISENDMHWANMILAMEHSHKSKIKSMYRHLEIPIIHVLDIPDEYEFMDEDLIDQLKEKVSKVLQTHVLH